MLSLTLHSAALITGYREVKCRDCREYFWMAANFIPGGWRCEGCRGEAVQRFKDESREIETEEEADDE